MNVLLLHACLEGGYRRNLERLRQLEVGAQALYPDLAFVRALGRTPDEDPLLGAPPCPERLLALLLRLVAGGARQAWLCSPPCPEVLEQEAEVERAGCCVTRLAQDQVEGLLAEGARTELLRARRQASGLRLAGERVERGWTPEGVVLCWLRGAESVLGARALPLPPPDGQGNLHARAEAQVEMGLRLAYAHGVITQAQGARRWPRGAEVVLRLVLLEGRSYQQAALAAELGNAMAAHRAQGRALDCVREVLLERRAREQQEGA